MATYNLQNIDKPTLDGLLSSDGISRHTEVVNYLSSVGLFPPPSPPSTIVLESQTDNANGPSIPLDPTAQFLIVTSNDIAVNTDAALKGIVDTAGSSYLFVRGNNNAVVSATDGNNHLYIDSGSGNIDAIYGAGNDWLDARGSTGANTLDGGAGNDTLWAGSGATTMIGGGGDDLMSFVAGSGTGTATSGSTVGHFNVLGDANSVSNTLYGGAGADSLFATGTGSDSLLSGSASGGSNYLEGHGTGLAHNTLHAGAGNDLLYSYSTNGDDLIGGTGNASLSAMAGSGSGHLTSGSASGGFNVLGDNNSVTNTLQGSAGNDSLYATGSGSDTLISGTGSNLLDASGSTGAGNYLQSVGGGINTLWAGSGTDTLDGSTNTNTTIFYSHAGADASMAGGASTDAFQVSNDTIGGAGTNIHTVNIDVGSGSPEDYVGFQNRASTDIATNSGPVDLGGGKTGVALTFTDGQTVNVEAATGSGAHVELIFTDTTIKPTF